MSFFAFRAEQAEETEHFRRGVYLDVNDPRKAQVDNGMRSPTTYGNADIVRKKLGVEVFLKSCEQFKEREENLREFTKT